MKALIIVDVQNDFMPGGPLPAQNAHDIIPVINNLMPYFPQVIATKDWHPQNHKSFASQHKGKKPGDIIQLNDLEQVLWPDHCVQNTKGAEFVDGLDTTRITKTILKGTNEEIDSYSGFFDNAHLQETGLDAYLRKMSVTEIYAVGVATDYCVKYTVLDACQLSYKTTVLVDGCKGVNLNPKDVDQAIKEMRDAGAQIKESKEVVKHDL